MSRARNLADAIAGNFSLPVGALGNAVVGDGDITTAKLAAGAVTAAKLDLTDNYAFTGTVTGAGASQMSDLSDYEEGSSQLSFTDGSSNTYTGGYSSSNRYCKYTRSGRLIFCVFRCITNSGGSLTNGLSSTAQLQLSGLPYAAASTQPPAGIMGYDSCIIQHDTNEPTAIAYAIPGTSKIGFKFIADNTEWINLQVQDITVFGPGAYQGYEVSGSFWYYI